MSDKPLDTPLADFSLEELEDMSNDELMDRGIALNDFGLDGWLDGIVQTTCSRVAFIIVKGQLAGLHGEMDQAQVANEMQALVSEQLAALADCARRIGQREGKGEL